MTCSAGQRKSYKSYQFLCCLGKSDSPQILVILWCVTQPAWSRFNPVLISMTPKSETHHMNSYMWSVKHESPVIRRATDRKNERVCCLRIKQINLTRVGADEKLLKNGSGEITKGKRKWIRNKREAWVDRQIPKIAYISYKQRTPEAQSKNKNWRGFRCW